MSPLSMQTGRVGLVQGKCRMAMAVAANLRGIDIRPNHLAELLVKLPLLEAARKCRRHLIETNLCCQVSAKPPKKKNVVSLTSPCCH